CVNEHGVGCSCPDFIFNRDGKDVAGCKHIACLRAWGLVPAAKATHRSEADMARNAPEEYARMQAELADDPHRPEAEPWSAVDFEQHAEACGQWFDDEILTITFPNDDGGRAA